MNAFTDGQRVQNNTESFNSLLNILRQPPTEEEKRILSASNGDEDGGVADGIISDLTPEERAELEAIEAEINEELLTFDAAPDAEEEERQEQLDALVMTQARGIGALLGFAQNTVRPTWIRAKAMKEIVRQSEGNDQALCVGAFRLGAEAIPADAPRVVNTDGLILEKDVNEVVHAECLTRKGKAGYALAMDLAEEGKNHPLTENALIHVALFDRQSGTSFRHATARLERQGDSVFHVDLFEKENLSRTEMERADALFWVEADGNRNA